MDAAVRHEAEQVDAPSPLERALEGGAVEEGSILDRLVHAHQILVEPAAGADRQVPDLGIAHLPRRQPDGLARGHERRVRVLAPEPVEDRRLGQLDGVARPLRGAPPAVEDDEDYERDARQIAAKESTSREAPPTSAPSTDGCASSSPALSGLTEPP